MILDRPAHSPAPQNEPITEQVEPETSLPGENYVIFLASEKLGDENHPTREGRERGGFLPSLSRLSLSTR